MRVLLKLELDCPPDAAWRAIRSPAVLTAVSAPFTKFTSMKAGGFPEQWPAGVHPVQVRALGGFKLGEQTIDISYPVGGTSGTEGPAAAGAGDGFGPADIPGDVQSGAVRMMRDTGKGLSGPLALVTLWQHTMAIAEAPGGKTLYRDQLVIEAGALTPLLWPLYWAFWQWRAIGITRLARRWK